jgi:hypothetical protein
MTRRIECVTGADDRAVDRPNRVCSHLCGNASTPDTPVVQVPGVDALP